MTRVLVLAAGEVVALSISAMVLAANWPSWYLATWTMTDLSALWIGANAAAWLLWTLFRDDIAAAGELGPVEHRCCCGGFHESPCPYCWFHGIHRHDA